MSKLTVDEVEQIIHVTFGGVLGALLMKNSDGVQLADNATLAIALSRFHRDFWKGIPAVMMRMDELQENAKRMARASEPPDGVDPEPVEE